MESTETNTMAITWESLNSIIEDNDRELVDHIILPSLVFSQELTEKFRNPFRRALIAKQKIKEKQALSPNQEIQLVHLWSQKLKDIDYSKLSSNTIDSLDHKKECGEMHRQIVESLQDEETLMQFISGDNYELSLMFLDFFVYSSINRGIYTYFDKNPNVISGSIVWDNFLGSNRKGNPDYKNKRQLWYDLQKQSCTIKFSFNNMLLDLGETIFSLRNEDIPQCFSILSILASTWAVWEKIYRKSLDSDLNQADNDTKQVCEKLSLLYDVITMKQINWATLVTYMSLSQSDCMNKFIIAPLNNCTSHFKHVVPEEDKEKLAEKFTNVAITRFFNAKHKKHAKTYLTIMTDSAIAKDPFSKKLVSPDNYLYLDEMKGVWKSYAEQHTDNIENLVKYLFSYIYNENWIVRFNIDGHHIDLREKLLSIRNESLIYKISVLSIIATTWSLWDFCNDIYALPSNIDKKRKTKSEYSEVDNIRVLLHNLCCMIFPENRSGDKDSLDASPYIPEEDPDQLLETAKIAISNDNSSKAVETLTDIVTNYSSLASPETLAAAYEALNICIERNWDLPKHLSNVHQNKLNAKRYGSANFDDESHNILPDIPKSTSEETGYYYLRTGNDKNVSKYVESTKPDNWYPLSEWFRNNAKGCTDSLANTNIDDLLSQQTSILSNNLRFIFIEPDYNRNVSSVLQLLDLFQKLINHSILDSSEWGNIEIIVRCNQEQATPILDTAYSFLEETDEENDLLFASNPIKIYLLDEKKRSADLLYAQHPLFYPLTSPRNKFDLGNKTFNLVIISNNSDLDYTIWLIRQAFWLLPHTKDPINSKITVLSPNADKLCVKTASLCPGLSAYSKKPDGKPIEADLKRNVNIEDISFPEIEYCTISMDGLDIQNRVSSYKENDILYYVIDSETDLEGITLATQLREFTIKKNLQRLQLKGYTSDDTVVAVRCRDIKYANLVKQLIIPKEEENSNRWFNDYKLIPFGIDANIFSWDELAGGIIEFMSECMHFQYCTEEDQRYDFETPAPDEYIWTYHRRLYNRDSSYSAAMSLPYRLYEAGVVLDGWEFKNPSSYWSQENREKLANSPSLAHNIVNNMEALSKWEHTRWCCYLFSTGWLPATPTETKHYMNNGVTRHSLQIAKLHPCLCSWDALKDLYQTLHKAYIGSGDDYDIKKTNEKFRRFSDDNDEFFQCLDNDNIFQTQDILRAKPLGRAISTDQKEH